MKLRTQVSARSDLYAYQRIARKDIFFVVLRTVGSGAV